jgi:hypothetical protein
MTNPLPAIAIELIQDLVTLGYLAPAGTQDHAKIKRAVTRFQRHAQRPYRMPQPDVAPIFKHKVDGVCDASTAAEIRLWIQKRWQLPLGRFQISTLTNIASNPIRLRQDAAAAWSAIVNLATSKGATLGGQYGDSLRGVHPTAKPGSSRYSFHYSGRAVDISQDFTKSADHRYYIEKDTVGSNQFWRIWCKADKQDGSQGTQIRKHTKKWYDFKPATENWIPDGYYVDLTTLIESTQKFERIHAQSGWEGDYNKTEWWHFQYKLDKQTTFQDEMELIGVDEARLRICGWNDDATLDHAPG